MTTLALAGHQDMGMEAVLVTCDVGETLDTTALFKDDDSSEIVTRMHNGRLGDLAFNARLLGHIRSKYLANQSLNASQLKILELAVEEATMALSSKSSALLNLNGEVGFSPALVLNITQAMFNHLNHDLFHQIAELVDQSRDTAWEWVANEKPSEPVAIAEVCTLCRCHIDVAS